MDMDVSVFIYETVMSWGCLLLGPANPRNLRSSQ